MRDPRDVFTSLYPFMCKFMLMKDVTREEFAEVFLSGYCPFGDCVQYFLNWWKRRDDPNVLIVKYEELKKDPARMIRTIADYMGKDITDEAVKAIVDFTSVENMRKNGAYNLDKMNGTEYKGEAAEKTMEGGFIRTGKSGAYKEEMSAELQKRFEEYMKPLAAAGIFFN